MPDCEKPKAGRNHVLILVFLAIHKQIQLPTDAQSVLLADAMCSEQRQNVQSQVQAQEADALWISNARCNHVLLVLVLLAIHKQEQLLTDATC